MQPSDVRRPRISGYAGAEIMRRREILHPLEQERIAMVDSHPSAPRTSKRVPGAELRHRRIPVHGVGKCGIVRTIVHGCTGSSIKPDVSREHGVVGAARKASTVASTCGARNAMGQRTVAGSVDCWTKETTVESVMEGGRKGGCWRRRRRRRIYSYSMIL